MFERAIEDYDESIRLDPENAVAYVHVVMPTQSWETIKARYVTWMKESG